jgi:site-specific recombinase XerD
MGKRLKITKTTVDNLPVDSIVWDSECTGLHVRRQKSEAKVYSLFYRSRDGRQRFMKIGRHGAPWTVDEARKKAREILVDVANGKDPAGERYDDRKAATVAELCDLYLADAAAGKPMIRGKAKKASTLLVDKSNISNHIKPLLGNLKVAAVTRRDIERFRDAVTSGKTASPSSGPRGGGRLTGGQGAATRTQGLLGGIFSFAIKSGMRTDNPVHGVERHADGQRTRRATEAEYTRLGEAMMTIPNVWPVAIAAAHFLCLTGWRRGEMLTLKWSEVDLASRTARLSDTKTGASMRPLSHAACAVLQDLPRLGVLVFPASRGVDQPMAGFHKAWLKIAKRASLPADVTPHILRHSFASVAADLGYSELTIAAMIGHRLGSITSKYSHHADAVLLAAADKVARHIEELLGFAEPAGVVVEADFTKRSA